MFIVSNGYICKYILRPRFINEAVAAEVVIDHEINIMHNWVNHALCIKQCGKAKKTVRRERIQREEERRKRGELGNLSTYVQYMTSTL